MRKPKSKPLIDYLKQVGAWDSGNTELIEWEKKKYRKNYLKLQKQRIRRDKKHITIILEDYEEIALKAGADSHGINLQKYLKQSALHYHAGRFLVPHGDSYLKVKEIVFSIQRDIQELKNKESRRWFSNINDYQLLSDIVMSIVPKTEKIFQNPKLLMDAVQRELSQNINFKLALLELIESYDNKITRT